MFLGSGIHGNETNAQGLEARVAHQNGVSGSRLVLLHERSYVR